MISSRSLSFSSRGFLSGRGRGRRGQQVLKGGFHRGGGPLPDQLLPLTVGNIPRAPFPIIPFTLKRLIQPMSDRQAPVFHTFRNHPLRPQMHGQMGPVVIAFHQLVPHLPALLLPGFELGNKLGIINDILPSMNLPTTLFFLQIACLFNAFVKFSIGESCSLFIAGG